MSASIASEVGSSVPDMTTTAQTLTDYGCPDWCKGEHWRECGSPEDLPLHSGLTMHGFHVDRLGDSDLSAWLDDEVNDELSAADLRQLAANAIVVAEWMEANS